MMDESMGDRKSEKKKEDSDDVVDAEMEAVKEVDPAVKSRGDSPAPTAKVASVENAPEGNQPLKKLPSVESGEQSIEKDEEADKEMEGENDETEPMEETETASAGADDVEATGTAEGQRKARQPWKKPEGMPKRPLSAYNIYFRHERRRLLGSKLARDFEISDQSKRKHRKTHGVLGFSDMAKIISQRWKTLDEESRRPFEGLAAVEKEKYRDAMKKWRREQADLKKGTKPGAASLKPPPSQEPDIEGSSDRKPHSRDLPAAYLGQPPGTPPNTMRQGFAGGSLAARMQEARFSLPTVFNTPTSTNLAPAPAARGHVTASLTDPRRREQLANRFVTSTSPTTQLSSHSQPMLQSTKQQRMSLMGFQSLPPPPVHLAGQASESYERLSQEMQADQERLGRLEQLYRLHLAEAASLRDQLDRSSRGESSFLSRENVGSFAGRGEGMGSFANRETGSGMGNFPALEGGAVAGLQQSFTRRGSRPSSSSTPVPDMPYNMPAEPQFPQRAAVDPTVAYGFDRAGQASAASAASLYQIFPNLRSQQQEAAAAKDMLALERARLIQGTRGSGGSGSAGTWTESDMTQFNEMLILERARHAVRGLQPGEDAAYGSSFGMERAIQQPSPFTSEQVSRGGMSADEQALLMERRAAMMRRQQLELASASQQQQQQQLEDVAMGMSHRSVSSAARGSMTSYTAEMLDTQQRQQQQQQQQRMAVEDPARRAEVMERLMQLRLQEQEQMRRRGGWGA